MTTGEPASKDDSLPERSSVATDGPDAGTEEVDLTGTDPMIVLRYEVLPRPLVGAYLLG